jgi:hypothetical protein
MRPLLGKGFCKRDADFVVALVVTGFGTATRPNYVLRWGDIFKPIYQSVIE